MRLNIIAEEYNRTLDLKAFLKDFNTFINEQAGMPVASLIETVQDGLSSSTEDAWLHIFSNYKLVLNTDGISFNKIFDLMLKKQSETLISVIQKIILNHGIASQLYEMGEVILANHGYIRTELDDYIAPVFKIAGEYKGKKDPGLLFTSKQLIVTDATGIFAGLEFVAALNRTLLFRMPSTDGATYRACKIKKINEDSNELLREYQMLNYLRSNSAKLKLKSNFPEPVGVYILADIMQYIPENIRGIVDVQDNKYVCYLYDAPKEYFAYIHDENQTNAEFIDNFKKTLHDVAALFKQGIVYHQLIDLFHTTTDPQARADGGKYLSSLSLLDPGGNGQGKLATWLKSAEYPNIRRTGLADFGDMSTIQHLFDNLSSYKRPINGVISSTDLTYNYIADFFLIIELIVGYRTRKIQDKNPGINATELWQQAVLQIIELSNYLSSVLEIIDNKGNVLQYASLTNLELYRKQLQYFMATEYIADITQGKIKEGLYADGMQVEVDYKIVKKAKYWDPKIGFISPESSTLQDLGPYNGPYPICAGVVARSQLLTYFATKSGLADYAAGWNKTGRILCSVVQRDLNNNFLQAQRSRPAPF